jgi:hypothetical protein
MWIYTHEVHRRGFADSHAAAIERKIPMKPANARGNLSATRPLTIPVIERLESRTLLAAAVVATKPPPPKPAFAISDIFGAAAGFPIWQSGQPVLPASAGPANASTSTTSLAASSQSGTGNGTLLGSATVIGGPAIFSLLPMLPPDDLAAAIVGMVDPSNASRAAIFNSGVGSNTSNI